MSEDEITKLQEAAAHQEQMMELLNDIVTKQWDEIEHLKKALRKITDKIDMIEDNANAGSGEGLSVSEQAARDKPPHW